MYNILKVFTQQRDIIRTDKSAPEVVFVGTDELGVAVPVDGGDVSLQVSGVEVADLCFGAFLVGQGGHFSGGIVVVAQGLVSGLFGEEDAVVVVVSGGFAVYRFRASLAVGEAQLLFYLINIENIPAFRQIRYRYIVP